MKKQLMAVALAAACCAARGQTNAPPTLLPENVAWTIGWDRPDLPPVEDAVVAFRLYVTQTFTNRIEQDLLLGSVTNKVWQWPTNATLEIRTFQTGSNYLASVVPGVLRGTNAVALTAVNELGEESDKSEPLVIRALGKPLAPQALRKL